ncbi:MAG TPA: SCO family protein [Rhizomicrobium sp.]|nr:SCO family protein [Rhizomicrobium sp.]
MKRHLRIAALAAAFAATLAAAGCGRHETSWYGTNITGVMPQLTFSMTRASDGKTVSAKDFRGREVLLYFGYTNCPDVCPTTLANITAALNRLGARAKDLRVLFVTVDPDRDKLSVLDAYVKAFSPEMVGLRGDADALAKLARRYRVAYSVDAGPPYEVSHSSAVFFFDADGHARVVTLATDDTGALAGDMKRLLP